MTELVLSIYTRRERVPEAEELLLCSSHTTLEEGSGPGRPVGRAGRTARVGPSSNGPRGFGELGLFGVLLVGISGG